MKTIFTTLIGVTLSTLSLAQNPDPSLARVKYTLTHIRDTTQRDKPHVENMLLVIGQNASVFTSSDKLTRDLEFQKQLQEQIKNQAGSGSMSLNIQRTNTKPITDIDYFYFVKENKFFTKERLFNNYLVEEDAPKINWKITKDTSSLSGIKCQKATAYFKGRNWIAWFAPELPFQSGPWKLNGLPGLIVEAYDEKKEVQFLFSGMENVNKEDAAAAEKDATMNVPGGAQTVKIVGLDIGSPYLGPTVKLPADAIKTTRKELDKLKEARDKDPQGFMNAQMAANGVMVGGAQRTQVRTTTGTGRPLFVTNNPIELPEKK